MSEICVYIALPSYLHQWLMFENNGELPIRVRKGSRESDILECFLIKRPAHVNVDVEGDGTPFLLPTFRYKDPESYNYLPRSAVKEFVEAITQRFDIELFSSLMRFGYIGKRRKNLIFAWMESHGIESNDTNWNALAQKYQRLRKIYLQNSRKKSTK